ncbi:MAG: hypothetical protein DRI26_00675 [Chloroflexi bacterium]|nr:MAG: hypothetical protein DRI26_00675 [Chloroflexota bacterium]
MSFKLRLRDYAAGSLVANGPAWLLSLTLPYLRTTIGGIFAMIVLCFTAMGGGVVAGYLVARRVRSEHVKSGLTTGLFSYALYAVFLTITGYRVGSLGDIPSLTGFVIGGAIGARLWEKRVSFSAPPLGQR